MKILTLKNVTCIAMICGTSMIAMAQPTASAPVPPEYAASKVISIYSDAYENPVAWNFGNWGSGTVYTAEKIAGKEDNVAKFVTTDLGYFGWELQSDVNAATMDKLHIDVYADEAFTMDITPICRTQASGEKPQNVSVKAGEWTSLDVDLQYYADNGLDLSGVFQLKYSGIGAHTLYIDNVYFYSTSTEVDEEAPANLTAELVSASYYSATLKCNATDNSGAVTFTVTDETNGVNVSKGAVSGEDFEFKVEGLEAGKDYNFTVSASDLDGNVCETTVTVPATTVVAPDAATNPTVLAENVISIYSDVYEPATSFIFGNWSQTTTATEVELGDGDKAYYLDRFNYLGMELNGNVAAFDATEMEYLHIDLYSPNITRFQITPIWGGEALYDVMVEQNKWNSIDVDLAVAYPSMNKTNIYQLKIQAEPGSQTIAFIDNIYFWKDDKSGIDSLENGVIRVYAANGNLTVAGAEGQMVCVYAVSGALVYKTVASNNETIQLEKGMYIVVVGKEAKKVIL
ncbi:MAG: hypothetical protein IAB88_05920 [Bacteroidetes bacterium]|uniref:Fibronectin type-III domain-containing protein n=1 Tax=Candidatus Limisoma faecipullorum TaxID=2840854 RepID=A0A9D9IR13_9BACT|nr:hypothetical protein [Candidatus Limisoma faecipullorum]